MNASAQKALIWAPRILGIGIVLFLSLFALDAFGDGPLALLMHLVPSLLLLVVIAAGWRRPVLAGGLFLIAGAAYSIDVWPRIDWILPVAGPMLLVGVLYVVSARSLSASRPAA